MNTTTTILQRSLKLLAVSCLSLGFGFVQTDVITAQSRNGTGSFWRPLECVSNSSANSQPSTCEQAHEPQVFVDAASLRELSAQRRVDAACCVDHYLGKTTAWQGYPSAQAVQVPSKQDSANTNRLVAPLIIRSPFADFSTRIPTIAAAIPSQRNAETCFRNGDYAEASSSVEGALRLDPDNGNLLMFAAMTNLAVANYDKAGKLFVAAATVLNVEDWKNVFAMADQFYGTNDGAQHLADFFAFCETTDNINARRLRGYLAFEFHQFETAQTDFEFVINTDTDDAIVRKLLASEGESSVSHSPTGDTATAGPQPTPAKTTSHQLKN